MLCQCTDPCWYTACQFGCGMQFAFVISGAADDRQLDVDMCDAVVAEQHPEPANPLVRMLCCDYQHSCKDTPVTV